MTAFVLRPGAFGLLARWVVQRSQSRFSLLDQGLVSGLGFVTGVAAARLLGLEGFGRFAIVMILAGLAQGLHNALVISPLMSLAGTPRGRSDAFVASSLAATLLAALPMAIGVALLLAALELSEGRGVFLSLDAAAGALAASQNLLLTVRRVLFARGRGGEGLLMDAARAATLLSAIGLLWVLRWPVRVDALVWLIACSAAVPALIAMAPVWRGAAKRCRVAAFAGRCWPMARWLLPGVIATFGQEQLVWIVVGATLGDAPVGGLRAAQYLVSLAYPFMAALENVVPVEASRTYRVGGVVQLRAYIARVTLAYSPLALGFPLLAALSATFWLHLFFGTSFEAFAGCLRVFALVVLFVFVRDMMGYFFRATQHTKVIFQAFVISSLVTLAALFPLLHAFGVLGAAFGIATGQGVSMFCLLVMAFRAQGRSPC